MAMAMKLGRYLSVGSSRYAAPRASLRRVRGLHSEAAQNHPSNTGSEKQLKASTKLLLTAGCVVLLALPHAIFTLIRETGPRTKTRKLQKQLWNASYEYWDLRKLLESKGVDVDLSNLDLGRS